MATGYNKLQDKISTSEILQKLKDDSDHTKFFYLYVSTAGKECEQQWGQLAEDEGRDESESKDVQMQTDDKDTTENTTNQPTTPPFEDNPAVAVVQNNLSSSSLPLPEDKAREATMKEVHQDVIPRILRLHEPQGWQKVCDKDMEVTYRALYFNTIPKRPDEDDTTHILRVSKVRKELKEVNELKERDKVNFKFNSLLSRPLLYDESALEEQSMREGSTQKQMSFIKNM